MNKNVYDVIIIGGGPSGITLAFSLLQSHYSTYVIEKSRFPRDKLCGGLMTRKSVDLYTDIWGKDIFDEVPHIKTDKVIVHTGLTKCAIYRKRRNPYIIVDRKIFDARLVNRFKNAGGNIKEEERKYKVDYDKKTIIMEDGSILGYRYLVGADGVYSVTRKYVDPSYIIPDGICLQTYHSDRIETFNPLSIHLYYGLLDVGYGWQFPREDGFLTGAISQVHNGDIKGAYAAILKLAGIKPNRPPQAMHIPFGKYVKTPMRNEVYLVGDAAGFVNPITGEGLYFAALSAKLACREIVNSIKRKNYTSFYCQRAKQIQWSIRVFMLLRKWFYNDRVRKIWFGLIWKKLQ